LKNHLLFAGRTIELLEKLYTTEPLRSHRDTSLQHLQLLANAKILDVGVGTAANALLLLQQTSGTRITGADRSSAMLRHSSDKLKRIGGGNRIQLICMDAHNPCFASDQFDGVIVWQVLAYLNDPVRALRNVRHCMKKSARIVLEDSDWDSPMYNCAGDPIWPLIRSAWTSQSARVDTGRRLKEFAINAGFSIIHSSTFVLQDDIYAQHTYGYWLSMIIADYLVSTLSHDENQIHHWLDTLQRLSDEGGYYFNLNRMLVVAGA
jgi:SAM-dependent methyltransferase